MFHIVVLPFTLAVAYVLYAVAISTLMLRRLPSQSETSVILGGAPFLWVVFIGPALEEAAFRIVPIGLILYYYPDISWMSKALVVLVQSALFGLLHRDVSLKYALVGQGTFGLLAGGVFVFLYKQSGFLVASVAVIYLHALTNLLCFSYYKAVLRFHSKS